jgi:hypothetical protein
MLDQILVSHVSFTEMFVISPQIDWIDELNRGIPDEHKNFISAESEDRRRFERAADEFATRS